MWSRSTLYHWFGLVGKWVLFFFLGAVLLGLVGTAGFCLYLLLGKWMIFKVKICEVGLGMMLVPSLP